MSGPDDPSAAETPRQSGSASSRPVARLKGVGLSYPRAPRVLDDVSWTVEAGSFHFLTGASGAGKSSLLRLLHLGQKPTEGVVELFGHDAAAVTRKERPYLRRRLGLVFQDFRLAPHLNVFDNVALPLRVLPKRSAAWREEVAELVRWVGLGDRLEAPVATLSGGEQQRVAIARAVVTRPRLILADEPTGSVDPAIGARILKLFEQLNRQGAAVIIATHDEALIRRSGRAAVRLQGGRLAVEEAAA